MNKVDEARFVRARAPGTKSVAMPFGAGKTGAGEQRTFFPSPLTLAISGAFKRPAWALIFQGNMFAARRVL